MGAGNLFLKLIESKVEGKGMSGEDQPIHKAASSGQLKKLKALLDKEPTLIGAEGDWGRTPLHAAAQAGKLDCLAFLIEQGADVNARDSLHSETPLFAAASDIGYKSSPADAVACVRFLLEHGADPNARDTHRRETALYSVSSLEVLNVLAEYGADLEVVSSEDQYAYEYHAYIRCEPAVLNFWLGRGVDVNHNPGFGPPVLVGVVTQLGDDRRGEEGGGAGTSPARIRCGSKHSGKP